MRLYDPAGFYGFLGDTTNVTGQASNFLPCFQVGVWNSITASGTYLCDYGSQVGVYSGPPSTGPVPTDWYMGTAHAAGGYLTQAAGGLGDVIAIRETATSPYAYDVYLAQGNGVAGQCTGGDIIPNNLDSAGYGGLTLRTVSNVNGTTCGSESYSNTLVVNNDAITAAAPISMPSGSKVNSKNICLADGTNCPSSGGGNISGSITHQSPPGIIMASPTTDNAIEQDTLITDTGGQLVVSDGGTVTLTIAPSQVVSYDSDSYSGFTLTAGSIVGNDYDVSGGRYSFGVSGVSANDGNSDTFTLTSGSIVGQDVNNTGGNYTFGVYGVGANDGMGDTFSLSSSSLTGTQGSGATWTVNYSGIVTSNGGSPPDGISINTVAISVFYGDAGTNLTLNNDGSGCTGTPGPATITGNSNGENFTIAINCL